MASALTRPALFVRVQEVAADPKVKSAETYKKSLRGVTEICRMPKTADPTCYTSPVSRKADPAVDAAGLFENQIRR